MSQDTFVLEDVRVSYHGSNHQYRVSSEKFGELFVTKDRHKAYLFRAQLLCSGHKKERGL